MKLKKANLGACEYVQKCEEVSERLHQRSDENKYIKSYNISNILDFSFFLVMMKDYYNENNRYVSASDEDRLLVYNELLNAVEMASSVTYDNMKKGVQKNLN